MPEYTHPRPECPDEGTPASGEQPATPPNASMDVAPELFVWGDLCADGGEDSPP